MQLIRFGWCTCDIRRSPYSHDGGVGTGISRRQRNEASDPVSNVPTAGGTASVEYGEPMDEHQGAEAQVRVFRDEVADVHPLDLGPLFAAGRSAASPYDPSMTLTAIARHATTTKAKVEQPVTRRPGRAYQDPCSAGELSDNGPNAIIPSSRSGVTVRVSRRKLFTLVGGGRAVVDGGGEFLDVGRQGGAEFPVVLVGFAVAEAPPGAVDG
jgi:hypothetical protein